MGEKFAIVFFSKAKFVKKGVLVIIECTTILLQSPLDCDKGVGLKCYLWIVCVCVGVLSYLYKWLRCVLASGSIELLRNI